MFFFPLVFRIHLVRILGHRGLTCDDTLSENQAADSYVLRIGLTRISKYLKKLKCFLVLGF
jgi:hypothetical protein